MADNYKTFDVTDAIPEVQIVTKTAKESGREYEMLRLVMASGDTIDIMPPSFDTTKLLKQEMELVSLRAAARKS